jgi:hypothetical protein
MRPSALGDLASFLGILGLAVVIPLLHLAITMDFKGDDVKHGLKSPFAA